MCTAARVIWASRSVAALCVLCFHTSATAQNLPTAWTSTDVGAPALSGGATYADGVFDVEAAGVDIWNGSDQFHFIYQQVRGDVEITARVDSLTMVHDFANAGVMIRASLGADAVHGYAAATSNRGVWYRRRLSAGALTTSSQGTASATPAWVRLIRVGSTVHSYWSLDGVVWAGIGRQTIPLGETAYVGLAVSSHDEATITFARFSNVRLTTLGLPPQQTSGDIGSPALKGSARYSQGTYVVEGAGADIWGAADQFHFVYQPMTEDGEVIARIASFGNTHSSSKAGVMIRESLTADSRHAMALLSPGHGYAFQRRPAEGDDSVQNPGGAGAAPGWVRLTRSGDSFQAFTSADGTIWTSIGTDSIPMNTTVYAGLAVSSHDPGASTTAVFDNVRIGGAASTAAASSTTAADGDTVEASSTWAALAVTDTAAEMVPSPWNAEDVGDPALTGSAIHNTGVFTVHAAGRDIWKASDQFHFIYQPVAGDVDVVARVDSLMMVHEYTNAGVMIRASLAADAVHGYTAVTAARGLAYRRRLATGGLTSSLYGPATAAPVWVRLVRKGAVVTSYSSIDGANWAPLGSETLALGPTAYVGLAVSSHNTKSRTTARFSNVGVNVPTQNQNPTVAITAPASGARFMAPATVTVSANASDPENRMAGVEFYDGTTLIGRDTTAPYAVSWAASNPGTYVLTAVAQDADGGRTTSSAVSVTISGTTDTAPRLVVFTASADHAIDVSKYVLKIYTSGVDPATATPVATSDLGKPTPDANGDITVDRSTFFSGLAPGGYVATVAAVGPGGQTACSAVAFTR